MSRWKELPWAPPSATIVANLYMESFEVRAIQSSPNPPSVWKRFVDDTFVIMKKAHKEEFLTHLNSVDSNIQFTISRTKARWITTIPWTF